MFKDLNLFRLAGGLAAHAAARQGVIAENVAQADTPGFRARDLPEFAELVRQSNPGFAMRTTRVGHGAAGTAQRAVLPVDAGGTAAPNGNSVSLDTEMMRAADARSEHDMALAVYKSSLGLLRNVLRV